MNAKLIRKKHESSNIWTYFFEKNTTLDYQAGQFIELSINLSKSSQDLGKRWFTLSSSPSEDYLSITTRITDENLSDYKKALSDYKIGSAVNISQAMGDFVLPKSKVIPLVFVAAGIGITPFRSMVKYLVDEKQLRSITLIHIVKNRSDLVFDDIFTNYVGCSYHPIVSDNKEFSINSVIDLSAEQKAYVYISGPEEVVETIRDQIVSRGYPEQNTVCDYFPGYPIN
ncbi:FAD-dependent oxidoreductase [Candidatus Saccharibacteria bacterium]|nr:FAD-dependent oxidoreductase [Candidatus Saccharibacteria bacterium]